MDRGGGPGEYLRFDPRGEGGAAAHVDGGDRGCAAGEASRFVDAGVLRLLFVCVESGDARGVFCAAGKGAGGRTGGERGIEEGSAACVFPDATVRGDADAIHAAE